MSNLNEEKKEYIINNARERLADISCFLENPNDFKIGIEETQDLMAQKYIIEGLLKIIEEREENN